MSLVPGQQAAFGIVDSVVFNPLLAPGKEWAMFAATLSSGTAYKTGDLLGRVTATGELVVSLAAAVDGSEVPVAILGQDVDATAADKTIKVFVEGAFFEDAVRFGAGHTADSVRWGLMTRGIHLIAPRLSGI